MIKKLTLLITVLVSSCSYAKTVICEYPEKDLGLGIPKVSWETDTNIFKQYDILGYTSVGSFKETDEFYTKIYTLNATVRLNNTTYNEFRVVPTRNKNEYSIAVATFKKYGNNAPYMTDAKSFEYYTCLEL